MALTTTVSINRAYDATMGNKRMTGGTIVLSGDYATTSTITANSLGLKYVEFFSIEGGTNTTNPAIAVTGIGSSVTLGYFGAAGGASGLTALSAGTAAGTYQWRAIGY